MTTRARRRTRCIFWHSLHTLPDNLAIRRSSLPGASFGIWSKEYIPVGTRFGPCNDITSEDLSEERNECDSKLVKAETNLSILDSNEETQPNWLGYINCTRNESQQNLLGFHLHCHQGKVELYYLNYKPIPANTELLIWHSKTLTKTLGLEQKDYPHCRNKLDSLCHPAKPKMLTTHLKGDDDLSNSVFCLEITSTGIKTPKGVYRGVHVDAYYREHLYTKANSFLCSICYNNFSSIKDLQVHIRAHRERITYECDICNRAFSRIYNLQSHKRTHSTNVEKPYICKTRDKRYSQRHFLKKHERKHLIEEAQSQYIS